MRQFEIEITIEGPYLTQSSTVGGYGVDAPLARTLRKEENCPYIPASLLKGKLKQAWEEIGASQAVELLGVDSGNQQRPGEPCEAYPATLHFDDLIFEGAARGRLTHRVRIDRDRGSVDEGMLLVLESPFESGAKAVFRGQARLVAETAASAADVKKWLEWGLRWTPSLGAERSTGFGRILGVKVTDKSAPTESSAIRGAFQFALKPQGLFCLSKPRLAGNLFESNSEIPGGVMKGMVARALLAQAGAKGNEVNAALGEKVRQYRTLCIEFERVRFTHAFPAPGGSNLWRPVRAPLSLVAYGDKEKRLYDAAQHEKPFLIDGEAPAFDIDWKKTKYPPGIKQFGWGEPKTELRVRTAIDSETLRASNEKLFALEMVNPEGFEWLGSADLSQVSEGARSGVAQELAMLLSAGLSGLGKTKTAVKARCGGQVFTPKLESVTTAANGEWRVTLMTPALLCDPAKLTRSSGNGAELLAAYRQSWTDLSNGAVELPRFFARQTLAGGHYLYKRFQKNRDYLPWLLTNAGSVFVLKAAKGREKEAGDFIQTAFESGLELPPWAKARYGGGTWESCPFVRENGYGEVAVNIAMELPEAGEVTDVESL